MDVSSRVWRGPLDSRGTHSRALSAMAIAALVTMAVHIAAIAVVLVFQPDRTARRIVQPLEVTLLTPPKVLPLEPPRPPQRPKPVVKTEVKPIAPPIEPVVIPDPVPDVVSEEPPLPVAPIQEEPAPVEVPIVPPNHKAAHLHNPAPQYPAIAKRLRIQGTVMVRVLVNPAGLPLKVELARSSGSPVLDDAALKVVHNWSFVPARRGAEPIEMVLEFPINFRLDG